MTTFLLVRHGAHDLIERTPTGWMPGVHLSALGRAQSERLAERMRELPLDAVYANPLAPGSVSVLERRAGGPVLMRLDDPDGCSLATMAGQRGKPAAA